MVETASPDMTPNTPTPNTPDGKAGPKIGDMQMAIAAALLFLLGIGVGMRLAHKFGPPSLPRAAKPCTDCEKRRAEEVGQRVAVRDAATDAAIEAADDPNLSRMFHDIAAVAVGDSSVPDDEPEEPEFDQTQVVAPTKVFSPAGGPLQ